MWTQVSARPGVSKEKLHVYCAVRREAVLTDRRTAITTQTGIFMGREDRMFQERERERDAVKLRGGT